MTMHRVGLAKDSDGYRVEDWDTHALNDDTPVWGCGCEGPLVFGECLEIDGCSLTAGDESPAGRCPHCEGLVYVRQPDWRELAKKLFEAMETPRSRKASDAWDAVRKALS